MSRHQLSRSASDQWFDAIWEEVEHIRITYGYHVTIEGLTTGRKGVLEWTIRAMTEHDATGHQRGRHIVMGVFPNANRMTLEGHIYGLLMKLSAMCYDEASLADAAPR